MSKKLIMLTLDGCNHCETAKDIYREQIESGEIEVKDVEAYAKKHPGDLKSLKIDKFPTIIAKDDDQVCEVDIRTMRIKRCVPK